MVKPLGPDEWNARVVEAEAGITALLDLIGVDVEDDGIRDTPARVVRAMLEMTSGLHEDAGGYLDRIFSNPSDHLVIVRGIRFNSLCEHHLLPFTGRATVAYLPAGGRVVGLSKIPRFVDALARRPQMQERLTTQIVDGLMASKPLAPSAAAAIVTATHACMSCRGARQPDADMVTSHLAGSFAEDGSLRAELMALHSE